MSRRGEYYLFLMFPVYFYTKITAMRSFFTFIILLAALTACRQKVISGVELENKLIKTMQDYLDETGKPGAVYKVEGVTFYADKGKKLYNCEFHVNVKAAEVKLDTTGIMIADIPNDFSKVLRKQ
jgi:hypothetical protein